MRRGRIDLHRIRAAAIDLDGVVYFGDMAAPGAAAAIRDIRAAGIRVFFITNNSSRNRREIAAKLNGLGIGCVAREIMTSGYATAVWVKKMRPRKPVMVIGSDSLRGEFKKAGVPLTDDSHCGVLVVGLDRHFTYDKIAAGLSALARGAEFIACNVDANFPVENGTLMPGNGAMVGALESAAGRKADVIIGKPGTYMLELIARLNELKPKEILVIGDRMDSDISMAKRFGSPAILVTRGRGGKIPTARSLAEAGKIIQATKKGGRAWSKNA
ncbi:MAG: HAD-IIA family hydrolase [Candidatus Aureabacteria bacterium]|nr:HAD-IIA family hydrolase [Candidatus Auribacterota bacterium]